LSEIIQNQSVDDQLNSIEGFSREEQQEIRAQIDEISGQNKISVSDELFKITPTKKGGTLPLVINILGIIAIVTSFYFTNRYFQEQEQTMAMEESSYESTEGSVIEELKRQAEEKLNKKQEEISQIQDELSKLDMESASLRENMDSQIKDKELELRSEMEAALADERSRLQSQNISTADLEKQLEEFQANRESAFNADIEKFRNDSALAIKEKEDELATAKQRANDILEQFNKDKATIKADTLKREAELTQQFEAEKEALAKETTEATQKLQELSELQKNEQLIQDQLTSSYNSIIESIKALDYPEAQINVDAARTLLDDPKIKALPSISKRTNVDLYFLDSMEKEIKQAGVRTTTDFSSMTKAAEILITARQSAEYGNAAENEGNTYDAKRFYNEALATLPQISRAVENLTSIESGDRDLLSSEYLDLGNKAVEAGQLNEAIKQYKAAAIGAAPDNIDSLSRAINGIEKILQNNMDKLEAKNNEAISGLNSELDTKEAAIEELEEELASLENSKIDLESEKAELESEKSSLEKAVTDNDKNQEEIKNNLASLSNKIEESENTIEQLQSEITESTRTIEDLKADARKSAYAIDALTKKAARATNRAEDLENELNDAVNQIVELIN